MIRTEERTNLDALAYNLIQLHKIKQQIENTTEDLEDFCENTSIKKPIKTRSNNILKKIMNQPKSNFGGHPLMLKNNA